MKTVKHVDRDGTIRDGPAPWDAQSRAFGWQRMQNLRAAQRAGADYGQRPKRFDDELARSVAWHEDPDLNPKPAEDYPLEHLRPRAGTVIVRRRSAYEGSSIEIPTVADHHRGAQKAAFFDVLAVAPDVRSVAVGDVVVAHAYAGRDVRALLGAERFVLRAPEHPCRRTDAHWCDGRIEERKEGCSFGGDILGVVEER